MAVWPKELFEKNQPKAFCQCTIAIFSFFLAKFNLKSCLLKQLLNIMFKSNRKNYIIKNSSRLKLSSFLSKIAALKTEDGQSRANLLISMKIFWDQY
jgi:hypothetical protein